MSCEFSYGSDKSNGERLTPSYSALSCQEEGNTVQKKKMLVKRK